MTCAILGDSIAVGIAAQNFNQCEVRARVGINSVDFANSIRSVQFYQDQVLISLGSNDYSSLNTHQALTDIRSRISANSRVTWLLSANNTHANHIAKQIAQSRGDRYIEVRDHVSVDRVHPTQTGYHRLSHAWRHN